MKRIFSGMSNVRRKAINTLGSVLATMWAIKIGANVVPAGIEKMTITTLLIVGGYFVVSNILAWMKAEKDADFEEAESKHQAEVRRHREIREAQGKRSLY